MAHRTNAIAKWVASVNYSDLPDETSEYAKALLLKTATGMIAGSREPISKILTTYFAQQGGVPDAGVVGGGYRTTVENAAYANATFAHGSELEDNELPSITSAYWMFPGLYPLAQKQVSTGKELIEAAVVSWEVASRYCRAAPGWMYMQVHICPPTWFGPLGVAAAAAKLLKLEASRIEHAITIAGSWGCGLGQAGCDTHFLESGHTVKMGIQSAFLAGAGATGELGVLEIGASGLYSPVAQFGKTDLDIIDKDLGKAPYLIHQACIKKYSACTFSHTSIDALGLIMKENNLKYGDIEQVETAVSPLGNQAVGTHPNPHDLQEARFSLEFLLSEVILKGGISTDTFSDTSVLTDPERLAARARIKTRIHPEFPYQVPSAIVTVTTKSNKQFSKRLDNWLGSPEHPISTEEIRQVCRPYLEMMLHKSDCDRIEDLVLNLDKQPDILEVMDILTYGRVGRRN